MSFLLLSALLLQPAAASSSAPHQPAAACAALDQDLPSALQPWRSPVTIIGALAVGRADNVVTGRPLTYEIAEAGTYGVALSIGAWIDVARDGQVVPSIGHGHGPQCSTIRKIVDFRLEPGRYTITLSRTDRPAARILVFRR